MIIVEERERSGQIDISNLEIRVNKKKRRVSQIVFRYENRIIHFPYSVQKFSAAEMCCSSSADNYRGQCAVVGI